MTERRERLHGAGLVAPDEAYAPSESPPPAAVVRRRGVPEEAPAPRSAWLLLWSAIKLASGLAVVVGMSLAVAFSAHRYALTSPRFAVKNLDLVGAHRTTAAQIKELSGVDLGANLFAIDTDVAEQKILQNPWISEVKLIRRLPGTLRVELAEREAVALATLGGHLYLVTRLGEPFKEVGSGDPYDLPVVSGASLERLGQDRVREIERIANALDVLREYDRVALSKVYPAQEVNLADAGDITLTVGKEGVTLALGTGPWKKKLDMAEEIVGNLRRKGRTPGILFLDNQAHPERVVVRMR
ncbi:MAG TPA: FtsQ-type POTRA domain-containing protein [Polyangiaceae bacterium]|jgi:cell division protein FtsQ